jgi:cytochrome c oxidase assembly protein subunit 15
VTSMQDAAPGKVSFAADRLRPVRIWLYGMAAFVLLIVVVGGITRLTESGLSITSWNVVAGVIPPLTQGDWEAEFEAYKQIPQYTVVNHWMSLEDFKLIFFWEWFHRLLARTLGFVFLIPFVVFLAQKRFSKNLALPLFGIFLLGGFQGFLGWWMVSSGLSELTSVSQYRLAAHLSAAGVLLYALLYFARRLTPGHTTGAVTSFNWITTIGLLLMLALQIAAGAFVAGMDAGKGYQTWPLMDGAIIPNGLFVMDPAWKNFFENALTVQFNHRNLAYLITLFVGFLIWRRAKDGGFAGVHTWLVRIGVIVVAQVVLGIATLLSDIQIDIAVAHQGLAFILAGTIVLYLADMRRAR